VGLAWRRPAWAGHRQRQGALRAPTDNRDTRSGHIPTPPRPRPVRARPGLPQGLAATFWNARIGRAIAAVPDVQRLIDARIRGAKAQPAQRWPRHKRPMSRPAPISNSGAFTTDVSPVLAMTRRRVGGAIAAIETCRAAFFRRHKARRRPRLPGSRSASFEKKQSPRGTAMSSDRAATVRAAFGTSCLEMSGLQPSP